MNKVIQPSYKVKQNPRKRNPGERPGTFEIKENSVKSSIDLYSYNVDHLQEYTQIKIEDAVSIIEKNIDRFHWLDIKGLGSQNLLNFLQKKFNINPLVMEDIVNTYQRPKSEVYDHSLFVVSRMLELDKSLTMKNEQISFLLFEKLIITFQEDYKDVLDPVRNRLRSNISGNNLRILGPSYLLYALMDTIIDHYFTIINRLGDELELIEDHLYQRPHKSLMYRIQGVKKITIAMRRASWPERDKLNDLLRSNIPHIHPDVKVYFRDVYDHSIQIIELIESFKETSTSLMDVYLSLMSNRMNEVMKFLTIISSIFIPLTFIAGIYGMNFAYQDPKTGSILPQNMPELYMPHGYIYVWVVMIFIALIQLWYFIKKGWFRN